MNRRRFLRVAGATGAACLAGCTGHAGPTVTVDSSASADDAEGDDCATTTSAGGPQSSYDALTLHRMPDYVTEYSGSVIVEYGELGTAAQRAVQRALDADGTYRQCTDGGERTDVMALFSHIERRWGQAGGESFEHTYLRYEGTYYGITLVQEGDFVRVQSIPCTAEACPATPTPPS